MKDNKNSGDTDSKTRSRLTRLVRVALAVYVSGVLISAPAVLGLFGYGLAHASDQSITAFLIVFAIVVVIAAGLPLTLLLQNRGPAVAFLKILGAIVMSIGALGLLKVSYILVIEPAWMTWRFSRATHAVHVLDVTEEPVYLNERLIGIKLNREIELTRAVAMKQYGGYVHELLTNAYVGISGPRAASTPAPFGSQFATVFLDGEPLDEILQAGSQPSASVLPKGRYLTTHVFYLWGLSATNATEEPCRVDADTIARQRPEHEGASNLPLHIVSSTRLGLNYRLGYRHYSTPASPLKYRYDQSAWMDAFSKLPIETCAAREQREKAEAQRVRAEQAERLYVAGDRQLPAEDNPLYKEICAGDVNAVRGRLALGTPPYDVGGKVFECTISKRNLDMFALLLPVLYAHDGEREVYCNVLEVAHRHRDLSMMRTIVALKLPLLCADAEQPLMEYLRTNCSAAPMPDLCVARWARGSNAWRAGLTPVDANGEAQVNFDPASRTDTVEWLQLLQSQGVPFCKTAPDQTNLLQEAVIRYPVDVIEFLLKSGCDPRATRPMQPRLEGLYDLPNYSAAMLWFIRSIRDSNDPRTASVDERHVPAITKAMGDISAEEINRYAPASNGVLLHLIAGQLPKHPTALRYLLARGARLNAASEYGDSWFDRVTFFSDNEWKPLLDMLTLEQLDELIHPVNVVTGQPGRALEALSNTSPYGLPAYLCSRGAIKC